MSSFDRASRKTTLFYAVLISIASLVVGMVIASRLDLSPVSSAQTIAMPAVNNAPLGGPIDATTFRNIAKAQSPMVVSIRTESRQRTQDLSDFFGGGNGGGSDDLLNRFFGGQTPQGRQRSQPREQVTQAAGSGFIINKDGFILTNNHVVEGATKIEVQFFDDEDTYYAAKVVGRDPLTDSALIQLTEKPVRPLPEAKFGDSDQMQPGDWVMAIGNPFGLAHTISVGVISATSRSFPVAEQRTADVLQTDAAINPGNSGGPLLNVRGDVVGMNTAIYSNSQSSGNIGIGFAIPINLIRDVLPGLNAGKVTRGRIGVMVQQVTPEVAEALDLKDRRGALVATVVKGGPAASAGIMPGDVIVEFNSKAVPKNDDLVGLVGATKPGAVVPVKVLRNGKELTLSVKVEELDLQSEAGQQSSRAQSDYQQEGGFGITLNNITPDVARRMDVPRGTSGAIVTDVDPGSPAARALQADDIILQVNRRDVGNASEASAALRSVPSGRTVGLLIWRKGQEMFITIRKP